MPIDFNNGIKATTIDPTALETIWRGWPVLSTYLLKIAKINEQIDIICIGQ